MALLAIGAAAATGYSLFRMYRQIEFRWPNFSTAARALSGGWHLFVYRGATSLYSAGNVIILGFLVTPTLVGYYAAAEKIARAILNLLWPASAALFPRMMHLVANDRSRAERLAKVTFIAMTVAGALAGIVLMISAPLAINVLMGPEFAPAIPTLRVLALLLPLVAASTVLGTQWMLSHGLDRQFTRLTLIAGVFNVGLAWMLGSLYAHFGMAWAVVVVEAFVLAGQYMILRRHGLISPRPVSACVGVAS